MDMWEPFIRTVQQEAPNADIVHDKFHVSKYLGEAVDKVRRIIRVHWCQSVVSFSRNFMDYEAVIGLETHVQLKTKSKMWCGCANAFGSPPNTNVCPVCLGLPGVLPVPNGEALRLTALTGLLLNCSLPARAKFDRKSYFYPDMPKNYQITQ